MASTTAPRTATEHRQEDQQQDVPERSQRPSQPAAAAPTSETVRIEMDTATSRRRGSSACGQERRRSCPLDSGDAGRSRAARLVVVGHVRLAIGQRHRDEVCASLRARFSSRCRTVRTVCTEVDRRSAISGLVRPSVSRCTSRSRALSSPLTSPAPGLAAPPDQENAKASRQPSMTVRAANSRCRTAPSDLTTSRSPTPRRIRSGFPRRAGARAGGAAGPHGQAGRHR